MPTSITKKLAIATVVSGTLSGLTFMLGGGLTVRFVPGILFGVATGIVLYRSKWFNIVQAALWLAASTGAWYAALYTYLSSFHPESSQGGDLQMMLLSGLVGSAILTTAFSVLRRYVGFANLATVTAGVGLAACMDLVLNLGANYDPGSSLWYVRAAVAFAIWQTGVGLSLVAYKR
jgi:hypothetical protein